MYVFLLYINVIIKEIVKCSTLAEDAMFKTDVILNYTCVCVHMPVYGYVHVTKNTHISQSCWTPAGPGVTGNFGEPDRVAGDQTS